MATLQDRFGFPLSTPSGEARDAYVAGVDSVLSGVAGYRESLERAISLDPSFAVAHVALARGLFLDGDIAAARNSAQRARELAASTSPRERSHVEALCLPLEGQSARALPATLAHLQQWARDAMVLAPATGVFGYYGFGGDPLHEEQLFQLLSSLTPSYGSDWWFDAVHAFAACETGRIDLASTLIERSLDRNARNAHGAHIRAHILYELGEPKEAFDYLDSWMPGLDRRSLMHCHLSWHLALSALATGRSERAWQAYRDGVHPGDAWGPPLNVVTDSASFLWRARLAEEPCETTDWDEVHSHALRSFPKAGVGFADVHTLLSCVATNDAPSLERLLEEIRRRVDAKAYSPGEVVIWLATGFAAYAAGRWSEAIAWLEKAQHETVRIGGSRAQRDLVGLTLMTAYLKAERLDEARALTERRAHLPILLERGREDPPPRS